MIVLVKHKSELNKSSSVKNSSSNSFYFYNYKGKVSAKTILFYWLIILSNVFNPPYSLLSSFVEENSIDYSI